MWTYVGVLLGLAALLAWQPLKVWLFERRLSVVASSLAGHRAAVRCNSLLDAYFQPDVLRPGYANPGKGTIVFQTHWCDRLRDHLRHPERADPQGIFSLSMLTHESMHIRGELNEIATECQAVQRNYRTGLLLGIPPRIAKANAMTYYTELYLQRLNIDGHSVYFSNQCAPGEALDERLSDSTWAP